MKWNCKEMCKKYNYCVDIDDCIVYTVRRELERTENPRRKGRIEIIYEADMAGTSAERFENCVYGAKKEE